jgi:Tfp pilus assembly protein PilF
MTLRLSFLTAAFWAVLISMGMLTSAMAATPAAPAAPAAPVAAAAAATPDKPASPDQNIPEITDAVKQFNNQNYTGAYKSLQDAVEKHKELPPAEDMMAQFFFRLAQVAAQNNQNQTDYVRSMRNWLEMGIQKNPTDPEAYLILGELAVLDNRVAEAELLYNKCSELMAGFKGDAKRKENMEPRILSGQATIAEAREAWPQAKKLLEDWLKKDPKNDAIMQRLARVTFQQTDATAAYDWLKQAREANPKQLLPEAALALYYEAYPKQREANHKEAVKWMEKAIKEAQKDDVTTRLVAAQWALETDQVEKAKEWASDAVKLNDKSIEAKLLRGVVALFLKDYTGAEIYFQSALLLAPGNFSASNYYALALMEQKDNEKVKLALDYAKNNYATNSRNAEAASTFGWALYKNKMYPDAERALRLALTGTSVNPDTLYYLAVVLADKDTNPKKDDPKDAESSMKERLEEAQNALKLALESQRPFTMKTEATALNAKLGGKVVDTTPATKPTGTGSVTPSVTGSGTPTGTSKKPTGKP